MWLPVDTQLKGVAPLLWIITHHPWGSVTPFRFRNQGRCIWWVLVPIWGTGEKALAILGFPCRRAVWMLSRQKSGSPAQDRKLSHSTVFHFVFNVLGNLSSRQSEVVPRWRSAGQHTEGPWTVSLCSTFTDEAITACASELCFQILSAC